jgi:hypothetical protein
MIYDVNRTILGMVRDDIVMVRINRTERITLEKLQKAMDRTAADVFRQGLKCLQKSVLSENNEDVEQRQRR